MGFTVPKNCAATSSAVLFRSAISLRIRRINRMSGSFSDRIIAGRKMGRIYIQVNHDDKKDVRKSSRKEASQQAGKQVGKQMSKQASEQASQ